MRYKQLGSSDLSIAQISLGGMSLKGGVQKLNTDMLRIAFEAGVNYFDTADLYEHGINESLIGHAVKGFRDRVILATKVGNQWRADGKNWDWKASKPYILKAVEASLSRLKTDHIDLYQLHGGTMDDPIDEIIEAFELLVKAGKIRYYGISSIRPNVIKAFAERSNIVSVMMQYSLLDRRAEDVFNLLDQYGISVIARGSLAQGLLIDKASTNYLQLTSSEVLHAQRNLEKFATEHKLSKLSSLLGYVLSHATVASAAIGLRSLAQLKELEQAIISAERFQTINFQPLEQRIRKLAYVDHL